MAVRKSEKTLLLNNAYAAETLSGVSYGLDGLLGKSELIANQ